MRFRSEAFRHLYESDIKASTIAGGKKWNDWCVDIGIINDLEDEFVKIAFGSDVDKLSLSDRLKLAKYLMCCIRFFPNFHKIVARLPSVLFRFEDSVIRGLIIKAIIFVLKIKSTIYFDVESEIKKNFIKYIEHEEEFPELIVDHLLLDFATKIDIEESYKIVSDINLSKNG